MKTMLMLKGKSHQIQAETLTEQHSNQQHQQQIIIHRQNEKMAAMMKMPNNRSSMNFLLFSM